jgi:hypothetical protein
LRERKRGLRGAPGGIIVGLGGVRGIFDGGMIAEAA